LLHTLREQIFVSGKNFLYHFINSLTVLYSQY